MNSVRSCFLVSLLLILSLYSSAQEDYKWYVLKSVTPVTEATCKEVIVAFMEETSLTEVWFNDASTSTFGCKDIQTVFWQNHIPNLAEQGYFLADISNGEIHLTGDLAKTSIFYQRAYYYSLHPEEKPAGYAAKLNESEWEALPESARLHYLAKGNYFIVN